MLSRRVALIVATAGLAGAAAIAGYVLFGTGSSSAGTPSAAVRALLDAGMHDDLTKAQRAMCPQDRSTGQVARVQAYGRITSYWLGDETTVNGVRYVAAHFATADSGPALTTEQFPVVKQGSAWQVCFSSVQLSVPSTTPGALPSSSTGSGAARSPGASGPPGRTAVPTGTAAAALCTGSVSSFGVAQTYIGLAELGLAQAAQACVYDHRVPIATAHRLNGKTFLAQTPDQHATVIDFRSTDNSTRVTVSTAREADDKYYVTAVTVG